MNKGINHTYKYTLELSNLTSEQLEELQVLITKLESESVVVIEHLEND